MRSEKVNAHGESGAEKRKGMGSIKQRAKEYAKCDVDEAFCKKCKMLSLCTIPEERTTFIAGAQSEHAELTRWLNPKKELPKAGRNVLVRYRRKDGGRPYYTIGCILYPSEKWDCENALATSANFKIDGWRYIHEN